MKTTAASPSRSTPRRRPGTRTNAAVISVGYNNYGHPTDEALARLNLAGARVYRTDIDGSITVRTGNDG